MSLILRLTAGAQHDKNQFGVDRQCYFTIVDVELNDFWKWNSIKVIGLRIVLKLDILTYMENLTTTGTCSACTPPLNGSGK
jgi:hypothetical protein